MASELLACPHGKAARVLNIGGEKAYSIIVDPNRHKCIQFGFYAKRSDAIAAWNTRAIATTSTENG